MKKYLKKSYTMPLFMTVLRTFSKPAQSRVFAGFTQQSMKFFAALTGYAFSSKIKVSAEQIAQGWAERMPSPASAFPVTALTKTVSLGEIHVDCPLRGTGNIGACYALMQFDRSIVEKMGGKLIVIESQANSGHPYCKVAICKNTDDWGDLKSAWPDDTAPKAV